MIASVTGRVAALAPDAAVVEVGGVGLAVQCTPTTLAGLRVGETATLATALVVRETELTLYGFADADEREVFEVLQSAAGVGPRLAQAVLAVHPPNEVRRAVALEDLAVLTRVPGIGKKGAQRIVLDLKDRLGPPSDTAPTAAPGVAVSPGRAVAPPWEEQLRAGLANLGYSTTEVEAAVAAVAAARAESPSDPSDATQDVDLAALLRQALRVLRPT